MRPQAAVSARWLDSRSAGDPGERAGAWDRGASEPADPRVAVQLDGGDRAGGVVRRALDPVDDATAAGAASAGAGATARGAGMAGLPDRSGAVRAGRVQRIRRSPGDAGEL